MPDGEARRWLLSVRLTDAERSRVRAAAHRDHAPLSKWMRAAMLNYALPLDAALLEDEPRLHEARVALREYCAEARDAPLTMREAVLLARVCDLLGVVDDPKAAQ